MTQIQKLTAAPTHYVLNLHDVRGRCEVEYSPRIRDRVNQSGDQNLRRNGIGQIN